MNEDFEKLKQLLDGAEGMSDSELVSRLKERYPFFSVPACMELRGRWESMSADERAATLAEIGGASPDAPQLERLLEEDGDRFDGFYPETPVTVTPSTDSAIDKFLATYGAGEPGELATIEKLIFNPVPDYSQQLAREEAESMPEESAMEPEGDSQEDRINRFIMSVRGKGNTAPAEEPVRKDTVSAHEGKDKTRGGGMASSVVSPSRGNASTGKVPSENSLLSESLAKIYIKTHRYERAYEILNRLSLAFPEKSAYFADQLRFLRKLMFIESCRQKRAGGDQ